MTHIIGKPPAPKQGATFADVPIRKGRKSLFVGRNDVAYIRMNRFEAIRCDTFETVEFTRDNEPVTLLDVTPRDPEPDPAVVEYEGVWRGEFFTDGPQVSPQDCTGLHMRGWDDECTRVSDGKHATAPSDAKVRRVPTSVVVHEEPGNYVERSLDSAQMFRVLCPAENRHITVLDRELQHIVQQGAALLARQDTKPEAAEAPSACPECGSSEVDEFEPVDGSPSWACSNCGRTTHPSQRKPENDPLVQRLAKDPEALKRFNECKPEATAPRCGVDSRCTRPAGHGGWCWSDTWHEKQDRSKPPPGWDAPYYGVGSWCIKGRCGTHAGFASPARAIAWTWAQHDAQQAENGGES